MKLYDILNRMELNKNISIIDKTKNRVLYGTPLIFKSEVWEKLHDKLIDHTSYDQSVIWLAS